MAAMGCVSEKMVNVSPESTLPITKGFKTIDANVKVTCSDPLSSANEDVANSLEKEKVFRSVQASSKAILSGSDVELLVTPEVIEDTHGGAEMGKAVFRGCLHGSADGAFANNYDYTVVLKTEMKKRLTVVGAYEATGKYSAQKPENSDKAQASEARRLAWEHALKLLIAKIKADRENIIVGLRLKE
jgi:hypothetical protein